MSSIQMQKTGAKSAYRVIGSWLLIMMLEIIRRVSC
jgi:hypothetical protein